MKKPLLTTKKLTIYSFLAFCLCFNYGWSQQVIGEFPIMDGGLEGQTAGNLASQGGSAINTPSTTWSISTTGGTTDEMILDTPADARSGNFSTQVQLNNDRDNARLQVPSTVAPNELQTDTEYTIQFFYKSPEAIDDGNLKPGIYLNNTSGGNTTDKNDVDAFVANTWIKTYGTETTGDTYNVSNWAVARIGGEKGVDKPLIHFDDFVVYKGAYDDVAPDPATTGTFVNNAGTATIGWTAPASGVDNGGYVVVRYASMPAADNDPNQNGIYQVGNTTTNGTGSLEGTVVYIGTAATFDDASFVAGSYYKVYAVDKAFNYSDELVVSDATASVEDFSNYFRMYPNPVNDILTIQSQNIEVSKVEIYNTIGQRVLEQDGLEKNTINVSSLNKGIYVLKLSNDAKTYSTKIVVE